MLHRKEIDGLRAVAILPVIFFHSGLLGMDGGYVGVDIFFVISGYLITSIIQEEINKNKFSIVSFYERRARRILPALVVVLFSTTIAAFILMPPDYLKSYSKSMISVVLFCSNIFFYRTSGYFSTNSDEKPLLHTWSLSVEEQYYIFFPIFLYLLRLISKRKLVVFIFVLCVSSLLLSQYLVIKQENDANFYLIFSRAWELFAGSLVALCFKYYSSINLIVRNVVSVFGFFLVILSIFIFDKNTPIPSFYAIAPILGAMLIILFCDDRTLVGRFLANKLFVFIGLISYSLYLWHQPLFAFLRMKTVGEPSPYMFGYAIALAFILSLLSYKYIEIPFRRKECFSRGSIFSMSLVSLSLFFVIGVSGSVFGGLENRFDPNVYSNTVSYSPKRNECHTKGDNYIKPDKACRYFGKNVTWASFGDSHIVEPTYALAKLLEPYDEGLMHFSFSACPPALLFDLKLPGCSNWINDVLSYLEHNNSIKNVLIGFRYSEFLYGNQLSLYPNLPDETPNIKLLDSSISYTADNAREAYWKSLFKIIERLNASGKRVFIMYPIPELPVDIIKAIYPFSIFGGDGMIDLSKTTSSSYYFARNHFIIDKLDSLPYGDLLQAIKPFEVLCNSGYCPAISDGKVLYFDDDHLSVAGADKLISGSMLRKGLAFVEDRGNEVSAN
ncbi:acyltransferase family protein [Methylomonas rhizoryzae]|uniref:acyltransferase family protein n=1 Tax=Methylomonas rhizoryzae TaxID=2608981 RepID=UPI001232447F|nr:acyltransferase family protein [Methylomonas rhizoryzae]